VRVVRIKVYAQRFYGGKAAGPPWAGDCEEWRLAYLEGEYEVFIREMELERRLLRHILSCSACVVSIAEMFVDGGPPQGEVWGGLFTRDLSDDFAAPDSAAYPSQLRCPRYSDYGDMAEFVRDRARWRIEVLDEILADARLELSGLRP
jgi:hypothetical protein